MERDKEKGIITMTNKNVFSPPKNILLHIASLVIIIWGVYQAQSVIVLILVALFLAIIGSQPILWLEKKHVPSFISVSVVLAVMIFVILFSGVFIGTSIARFIENLGLYQNLIEEKFISIKLFFVEHGIIDADVRLIDYMNPSIIINTTAGLLSGLTSALSSIVLILLIVTFILADVSGFYLKIQSIFRKPNKSFLKLKNFVVTLNHYMYVKTAICFVTGILAGLWLFILGIDFPILWGFLAFLLNYVPSLGSVIAALPPIILAYVQFGLSKTLLVALGYILINLVVGNIIEPKVVGKRVGLSTLVVFLSLIFWGSLLGLIGMVLCVPFTMALKYVLEINESTRWIALLLEPSTSVVKAKD